MIRDIMSVYNVADLKLRYYFRQKIELDGKFLREGCYA